MKNLLLFIIPAIATWACSSPCENYYEAELTCKEAAGVEVEDDSEEVLALCEDDDGTNDKIYECMTDAYGRSDCSTQEGLVKAAANSLECTSSSDTAN